MTEETVDPRDPREFVRRIAAANGIDEAKVDQYLKNRGGNHTMAAEDMLDDAGISVDADWIRKVHEHDGLPYMDGDYVRQNYMTPAQKTEAEARRANLFNEMMRGERVEFSPYGIEKKIRLSADEVEKRRQEIKAIRDRMQGSETIEKYMPDFFKIEGNPLDGYTSGGARQRIEDLRREAETEGIDQGSMRHVDRLNRNLAATKPAADELRKKKTDEADVLEHQLEAEKKEDPWVLTSRTAMMNAKVDARDDRDAYVVANKYMNDHLKKLERQRTAVAIDEAQNPTEEGQARLEEIDGYLDQQYREYALSFGVEAAVNKARQVAFKRANEEDRQGTATGAYFRAAGRSTSSMFNKFVTTVSNELHNAFGNQDFDTFLRRREKQETKLAEFTQGAQFSGAPIVKTVDINGRTYMVGEGDDLDYAIDDRMIPLEFTAEDQRNVDAYNANRDKYEIKRSLSGKKLFGMSTDIAINMLPIVAVNVLTTVATAPIPGAQAKAVKNMASVWASFATMYHDNLQAAIENGKGYAHAKNTALGKTFVQAIIEQLGGYESRVGRKFGEAIRRELLDAGDVANYASVEVFKKTMPTRVGNILRNWMGESTEEFGQDYVSMAWDNAAYGLHNKIDWERQLNTTLTLPFGMAPLSIGSRAYENHSNREAFRRDFRAATKDLKATRQALDISVETGVQTQEEADIKYGAAERGAKRMNEVAKDPFLSKRHKVELEYLISEEERNRVIAEGAASTGIKKKYGDAADKRLEEYDAKLEQYREEGRKAGVNNPQDPDEAVDSDTDIPTYIVDDVAVERDDFLETLKTKAEDIKAGKVVVDVRGEDAEAMAALDAIKQPGKAPKDIEVDDEQQINDKIAGLEAERNDILSSTEYIEDPNVPGKMVQVEERMKKSREYPRGGIVLGQEKSVFEKRINDEYDSKIEALKQELEAKKEKAAEKEFVPIGTDKEQFYIRVEKIQDEGNRPLTEREEGSLEKVINLSIEAGKSAKEIMANLNGSRFAFNFSDVPTIIAFLQDRIDGKDNRTFKEFSSGKKPTKQAEGAATVLEKEVEPEKNQGDHQRVERLLRFMAANPREPIAIEQADLLKQYPGLRQKLEAEIKAEPPAVEIEAEQKPGEHDAVVAVVKAMAADPQKKLSDEDVELLSRYPNLRARAAAADFVSAELEPKQKAKPLSFEDVIRNPEKHVGQGVAMDLGGKLRDVKIVKAGKRFVLVTNEKGKLEHIKRRDWDGAKMYIGEAARLRNASTFEPLKPELTRPHPPMVSAHNIRDGKKPMPKFGDVVRYGENEGVLVQTPDGVFVRTSRGDVVVESGMSGADLRSLGVEYVRTPKKREAQERDITTNWDRNEVVIDGKTYQYVRTNVDNKGKTVSVTLSQKGRIFTIRRPEDVARIESQKINYENQQIERSVADNPVEARNAVATLSQVDNPKSEPVIAAIETKAEALTRQGEDVIKAADVVGAAIEADAQLLAQHDFEAVVGAAGMALIKKHEASVPDLDRVQVLAVAMRLAEIDGLPLDTAHIAEALFYDTDVRDEWQIFGAALKKDGIEKRADEIERMRDAGVEVPPNILEILAKFRRRPPPPPPGGSGGSAVIEAKKYVFDDAQKKWVPAEEVIKKIDAIIEKIDAEVPKADAVMGSIDVEVEVATHVVYYPVANINIDLSEFQNRDEPYAKDTVEAMMLEGYSANSMNPIVLWTNPKDGLVYVISGHSRLEAHKRWGMDKIMAQFFIADKKYPNTIEGARQFAEDSNEIQSRTKDFEAAKRYRRMLVGGASRAELERVARTKALEGTRERIVNYAYLNPDGKAFNALRTIAGEGDTKTNTQQIASKIGKLRYRFPHLTDAHENELFDFFVEDGIPGDRDLSDDNYSVIRAINAVKFNPDDALNPKEFIYESDNRKAWRLRKEELEAQITELNKEINPDKETGWNGLKQKAVISLTPKIDSDATPAERQAAVEQGVKNFEANKDGVKKRYEEMLENSKKLRERLKNDLAQHKLTLKSQIEGDKNQTSLFQADLEDVDTGRQTQFGERQQIEREAKINGTWMRAPNGKPTNLNEQQWVTVRTKAFKEWFGSWDTYPKNASKVVDSNGEPLVVYHGTSNKFNKFESGRSGLIYFSEDHLYSKAHGNNLNPYFLNIKNIADLSNVGSRAFNQAVTNFNDTGGWKYNDDAMDGRSNPNYNKKTDSSWELIDKPGVAENLKGNGFTGIKMNEPFGNKSVITYATYSPNQIKLADGTNTTFDPNTGDIRFQAGMEISRKNYSDWAGPLRRLGFAWHGSAQVINGLDRRKIKGANRGELGHGFYFSQTDKALDYGDVLTFIDLKGLNIIEDGDFRMPPNFLQALSTAKNHPDLVERAKQKLPPGREVSFDNFRKEVLNSFLHDKSEEWSDLMQEIGYDGMSVGEGRNIVLYPSPRLTLRLIKEEDLPNIVNTQQLQADTDPEYLKAARRAYEKAARDLGNMEARMALSQAAQTDIFGKTSVQTTMFASTRDDVKSTLDPLRKALAEAKEAYDKARVRARTEADQIRGQQSLFQGLPRRMMPTDIKTFGQLIENLDKAIGGVFGGVLYGKDFENKLADAYGRPISSMKGKVYGFVNFEDGKVYINGDHLNTNSPIHEYGHVWLNTMKVVNPTVYNRGLRLAESSPYLLKLLAQPKTSVYAKIIQDYRDGNRAALLEEALAMAIGDRGESIVNRAQKNGFKKWLETFWNNLKSVFGGRLSEMSADQLQKLTFKQFTSLAAGQLVAGVGEVGVGPTNNVFPMAHNARNFVGLKEVVLPSAAQDAVESWKNYAQEVGKQESHEHEVVITMFGSKWGQPYKEAGYTVLPAGIKDKYTSRQEWQQLRDELLAAGKTVIGILGATQNAFETAQVEDAVEILGPIGFHVIESPDATDFSAQPSLTFRPHNFGDVGTQNMTLWGRMNTDLPTANTAPIDGRTSSDGFAHAFFAANNTSSIPFQNDSQLHFIGEKGSQAFKYMGADLITAKAMQAQGKDKATIKKATGWEVGTDGKWRYETPEDFKLIPEATALPAGRYKLIDYMVRNKFLDQILKQYPAVENIVLVVDPNLLVNGSWSNRDLRLTINPTANVATVFGHEFQHFLQGQEGFANGGSQTMLPIYRHIAKRGFSSIRATKDAIVDLKNTVAGLENSLITVFTTMPSSRWRSEVDAINNQIEALRAQIKDISEVSDYKPNAAYQEYLRLAGEVEARNATLRAAMTAEQRRDSLLEHTQDVATDQQIMFWQAAEDLWKEESADNNERQVIKFRAHQDGTWMRAPNGKPSNLDERQWVDVRTQAFKDWFGDWEGDPQNASKVVDANGEPLVVHHGTINNFTEFDTKIGQGEMSFFTPDKKVASYFGKKIDDFFLRSVKPFTSNSFNEISKQITTGLDLKNKTLGSFDVIKQEIDEAMDEMAFPFDFNDINDLKERIKIGDYFIYDKSKTLRKIIYAAGFDSIMSKEGGAQAYGVPNPNQIKSATQNTGAYSAASRDIRFQADVEVDEPAMPNRREAARNRIKAAWRDMATSGIRTSTWKQSGQMKELLDALMDYAIQYGLQKAEDLAAAFDELIENRSNKISLRRRRDEVVANMTAIMKAYRGAAQQDVDITKILGDQRLSTESSILFLRNWLDKELVAENINAGRVAKLRKYLNFLEFQANAGRQQTETVFEVGKIKDAKQFRRAFMQELRGYRTLFSRMGKYDQTGIYEDYAEVSGETDLKIDPVAALLHASQFLQKWHGVMKAKGLGGNTDFINIVTDYLRDNMDQLSSHTLGRAALDFIDDYLVPTAKTGTTGAHFAGLRTAISKVMAGRAGHMASVGLLMRKHDVSAFFGLAGEENERVQNEKNGVATQAIGDQDLDADSHEDLQGFQAVMLDEDVVPRRRQKTTDKQQKTAKNKVDNSATQRLVDSVKQAVKNCKKK